MNTTVLSSMDNQSIKFKDVFNLTVVVAALGYFVDVYDLVLFLIVGGESLRELLPGLPEDVYMEKFQYLLNVQMIGMLIGGLFWGIIGDKKGRLSVLFGSILMYSLANIANGLMIHIPAEPDTMITIYAILRLIAGIGLAGELGAGITLVSEVMSKETRGYGTMVVASVGVVGAVVAGIIGGSDIGWPITYYIGGGLGLSLLLLRIGVFESGIFSNLKERKVERGNFLMLFNNKKRAFKYLISILIGLPVWYLIGIVVGRGPVFAKALNVQGVEQAYCISLCYTGLIFGDILSGVISQFLKSRKKVFFIFYILCIISVATYLNIYNVSSTVFYAVIFFLGFSVGFWAVLVTVGSELFGTNVRATAATTIPNFIRASLVPIAFIFDAILMYYKIDYPETAIIHATIMVTIIVMTISFVSLYFLEETFGKDLEYVEQDDLLA